MGTLRRSSEVPWLSATVLAPTGGAPDGSGAASPETATQAVARSMGGPGSAGVADATGPGASCDAPGATAPPEATGAGAWDVDGLGSCATTVPTVDSSNNR